MLFLGAKSFCFDYYFGRGTVFVWLLGKWKKLGWGEMIILIVLVFWDLFWNY